MRRTYALDPRLATTRRVRLRARASIYHVSTGPLGTGIDSRAKTSASPGSRINDATIGAGEYLGSDSPCSSQNGARHAKYSANVASKSAREVIETMRCLNILEGPNRFAYHGATLRKSRAPCSSP